MKLAVGIGQLFDSRRIRGHIVGAILAPATASQPPPRQARGSVRAAADRKPQPAGYAVQSYTFGGWGAGCSWARWAWWCPGGCQKLCGLVRKPVAALHRAAGNHFATLPTMERTTQRPAILPPREPNTSTRRGPKVNSNARQNRAPPSEAAVRLDNST